ncbi:hypothetical protein B0H14DRAFT_2557390 [Mycena olivaceomarginata]|nr:hypothetical protein B0H14DRAFT_2557390 [Mycena olivaceomarginata]
MPNMNEGEGHNMYIYKALSIKARDELETSACGEPDMEHLGTTSDELNPRTTNRIDQVCDAPRDETHTEQLHPRDAVSGVHEKNGPLTVLDSFNDPITDMQPLRTVRTYALFGSRPNDFQHLLVGQRMGRDIPVSVIWEDGPGKVLVADDGSAFRLHLTAGPINAINRAIFKCSENSHEDLVNIRPEHQNAARGVAKSLSE